MAKLKDNRAIAMLDKAAKEKYAIPAVVVVRPPQSHCTSLPTPPSKRSLKAQI
jgi:hypothetical protein